jgi:hypothetical protein
MASVRGVLVLGVAVGAAALLPCGAAVAAESSLSTNLGLRLAHTDNISLAAEGAEQAEDIADVTAGITFSRQQPRADSFVAYQVQGIFYNEALDADEVYHNLDARTRLEVAPEVLFLDLFGLYDQTVSDPAGKYSFNNLALTGNRIDVAILGASPSVPLVIGNNAAGEIRYSHIKTNYDDPDLQDAIERTAHFALSNVNVREGGTWGVDYSRNVFEYGSASEFELEVFEAELGYWLNTGVRLFTRQGLEGDYLAFDTVPSDSGQRLRSGLDEHFWYVGLDWRPDDRTSLQLSAGERSFGRAHSFSWSRTLRFGGVSASYIEEPSSFLREQLRGVRRAGEVSPIDTLDGPRGSLAYLREGADVSFFYDRPRSDIGLRFFTENRYDLGDASAGDAGEPTEEFSGVELSLDWQVNARASVDATFHVANRRSDLNVIDDRLEHATLAWRRSIGRQTELSLTVAKQRSRARSGVSENYEENQFIVTFQRTYGAPAATNLARRYSNGGTT